MIIHVSIYMYMTDECECKKKTHVYEKKIISNTEK